jgi:hypothetical protein
MQDVETVQSVDLGKSNATAFHIGKPVSRLQVSLGVEKGSAACSTTQDTRTRVRASKDLTAPTHAVPVKGREMQAFGAYKLLPPAAMPKRRPAAGQASRAAAKLDRTPASKQGEQTRMGSDNLEYQSSDSFSHTGSAE